MMLLYAMVPKAVKSSQRCYDHPSQTESAHNKGRIQLKRGRKEATEEKNKGG